ncbi:class I SAM-dependent methyltransferase [Polyangium spumosum]|uniref:Methyltransferase domain-containing protein n=1 Tax=Polyangium spumosum TaxID=889282 RepID=A0A6N7PMH1_9BACT|nr:class I SAM-dependent methyltransferase [Polyangium spumosum]MRG92967.1 methyltransferase domain-containing protein [Polyangium spumosum]
MEHVVLPTARVAAPLEGYRPELEPFHPSASHRMDMAALLTMLDELSFRSMLDVGHRTGLVVREARERHPGRRIDGVDRFDFGAGEAARRLRRRYDVITAVHTLNQATNLDRAAANLADHLTAGGHLLIVQSTPASAGLGVKYLDPRELDLALSPHGLRRMRRLEYGNELLVYRKDG